MKTKFILASASPRRKEILLTLGVRFEVSTSNIDESIKVGETANDYVVRLALEKSRNVASRYRSGLVIGADTTVVIDGKILGKPSDQANAYMMLEMLSGVWHDVLTAVAVIDIDKKAEVVDYLSSSVKFKQLSRDEIDWYIASGEPQDKAGGYAIQGLGSLFIEEIRGNYLNIVGLPVTLLRKLVRSLGSDLISP